MNSQPRIARLTRCCGRIASNSWRMEDWKDGRREGWVEWVNANRCPIRIQNLNVTIKSEALNELSNYKLPFLVTYRFGISMRYTGIRRGVLPRPMGWGTQPLRRLMRLCSALIRIQNLNVTIKSEALNELSNYKLPFLVTYRFGISMRYTGIRRGVLPRPMGWGTQPLRRLMRLCSALIRIQNLNVTANRRRSMN